MKHTRKRRAFAQRPFPIGLTPFRGSSQPPFMQQRPLPFPGGILFYHLALWFVNLCRT